MVNIKQELKDLRKMIQGEIYELARMKRSYSEAVKRRRKKYYNH